MKNTNMKFRIVTFSIFLLLTIAVLSFLVFWRWVWSYYDAVWLLPFIKTNGYEYINYFNILSDGYNYFWYDSTQLISTRLSFLIFIFLDYIAGFKYWLMLYFALHFFCSWYFTSRFLEYFFEKKLANLWWIFFAFNIFSVYFLSMPGFLLAYCGLPLILYGGYSFMRQWKIFYVLIYLVGIYFSISYTRFIGIYWLFILLLFILAYRDLRKFHHFYKRIAIIATTSILLFLPFIFSIIVPYITGENEYFSWFSNYAKVTSGFTWYYDYLNSYTNVINQFIVSWLTPNVTQLITENILFIVCSFLFLFWIFIFFLFHKKNSFLKNKYDLFFILFFIASLFVAGSAKFLTSDQFTLFNYKIFPFLANNLGYIKLYIVLGILYFILRLLILIKNTKINIFLYTTSILYCILPIWAILINLDDYRVSTYSISDIPEEYFDQFYTDEIVNEATMTFPYWLLYFNWFDGYPNQIPKSVWNYPKLFDDNVRMVNAKQSELKKFDSDYEKVNFFNNMSIFNLKNAVVFTNISNAQVGKDDWLDKNFDFIGLAQTQKQQFLTNSWLVATNLNKEFSFFKLKNSESYEFKIYAPSNIINREISNFFDISVDILSKPVIIDSTSFNKPNSINNFIIPNENKNIHLFIKNSEMNPSKYYMKISDFDNSKPFLIQMNQTFWINWKVKWISKLDYDNKSCIVDFKNYIISQNSFCQYDYKLFDLGDIKFLDNYEVNPINHFEWNFIGNTWLITPDDIPDNMKDEKELYAIIIYEKQIWYAWTLVLAWVTFAILILLSLWECVRDFRKKKN